VYCQRHAIVLGLFLVFAHVHPLSLEVNSSLLYLLLDFPVRFWYIVEGEDAVAELEQEVCAKGDEGPEGYLCLFSYLRSPRCDVTYHWNNFLLYLLWEADDLHVYREVDLLHISCRVSSDPK